MSGKGKRKEENVEPASKKKKVADDDHEESGSDAEDEPGSEAEKQMNEFFKEENKKFPGKEVLVLGFWEPADEDAEPTFEDLKQLPYIWAAPGIGKEQTQVFNRLDKACDGLGMLWSSHTPIMQDIFAKEIKKVEASLKKKDYPGAFNHLIGTVVIMKDIDHWHNDVEEPKSVNKLMTAVKKTIDKVLAQSDEELGIAGEGARAKVIQMFKEWGDEILGQEDFGYKFKWF